MFKQLQLQKKRPQHPRFVGLDIRLVNVYQHPLLTTKINSPHKITK